MIVTGVKGAADHLVHRLASHGVPDLPRKGFAKSLSRRLSTSDKDISLVIFLKGMD